MYVDKHVFSVDVVQLFYFCSKDYFNLLNIYKMRIYSLEIDKNWGSTSAIISPYFTILGNQCAEGNFGSFFEALGLALEDLFEIHWHKRQKFAFEKMNILKEIKNGSLLYMYFCITHL